MSIYDLTSSLDLKQNLNIYATCKQFDNLNLILSIYDHSISADLTNYNVRLRAMKADKVPLIQEHVGITPIGNVVTIEADEQLTTTAGRTPIELQFINKTTGKKKATFNLVLIVVPSTLEVDRTISKATYTLLEELENKLDQASDFLENIDEAINANSTLETTIANGETAKSNLDGSISTGTTLKSGLNSSISTGNTTKDNLDESITDANTSKSALDTSKTNADTSKVDLDISIAESEQFAEDHADVNNLITTVANHSTQLSEIAINIVTLGADNKGVSDNSTLFATLFSNVEYTNKTIYFPDGTYNISLPIDIKNNCNIQLSKNAIIKATTTMDYILSYNPTDLGLSSLVGLSDGFIKGGIFDCNNLVKDGIRLSQYLQFELSDGKCINFLENGLVTRSIGALSGNLNNHNFKFYASSSSAISLGINDNGRDNTFIDISMIDCKKAIYTSNGMFTRIWPWLKTSSLYIGSIFADIGDGTPIFTDCVIDTLETGFKLNAGYRGLIVNGLRTTINIEVATLEMTTANPMVIFKAYNNTNRFFVSNVVCENTNPFTFCNFVDMPYSSWVNINYNQNAVGVVNPPQVNNIQLDFLNQLNLQNINLDNVRAPGDYTIVNVTTNNITNYPVKTDTTSAAMLHVLYGTLARMQFYIELKVNPKIFVRKYTGSAWSSWTLLTPFADNITTLVTNVVKYQYFGNNSLMVYINDDVSVSYTITAWGKTTLGTLPSGTRPLARMYVTPFLRNSLTGTIYNNVAMYIDTTGEIVLYNNSSTDITINQIYASAMFPIA